jgi:hypothetical protein
MKKAIFVVTVLFSVGFADYLYGQSGAEEALRSASMYSQEEIDLLRRTIRDARSSGIPERKLERIVSQGVANGITERDLSSLLGLAARAETEDLPSSPVVDKILEGLAKQVPPERITRVTNERMNYLKASKGIVEKLPRRGVRGATPRDKEEVITSLAESMARGVPERSLREIANYRGLKDMKTLGNVAEDLVSLRKSGVRPDAARDIIRQGIDRGVYNQKRRGLAPIVTRGKRSGLSDGEIKDRIRSGFKEGRKRSDLMRSMRPPKLRKERKGRSRPGLIKKERGKGGRRRNSKKR